MSQELKNQYSLTFNSLAIVTRNISVLRNVKPCVLGDYCVHTYAHSIHTSIHTLIHTYLHTYIYIINKHRHKFYFFSYPCTKTLYTKTFDKCTHILLSHHFINLRVCTTCFSPQRVIFRRYV
jgi:hypothetical protein